MKKNQTRKFAWACALTAMAVVGSTLSFPAWGSKCAPVQHMINILSAIWLGPGYAVLIALCASIIRNLTSLGSLLAFPGSLFGAFLCGFLYRYTKKESCAIFGEVFGTSVIGALAAYPVAVFLMGKPAAKLSLFAFVFPFFLSTSVGALLSVFILKALRKKRPAFRD